jgi:hypothetical protein
MAPLLNEAFLGNDLLKDDDERRGGWWSSLTMCGALWRQTSCCLFVFWSYFVSFRDKFLTIFDHSHRMTTSPCSKAPVVGTARAQSPRTLEAGVGTARAQGPRRRLLFSHSPGARSYVPGFGRADKSPKSPGGDALDHASSSGSSPSSAPSSSPTLSDSFSPVAIPPDALVGNCALVPDETSRLKVIMLQKFLEQRPANTKRAIDPKVKEWTQFCDHVYYSLPENERYLLNSENTYKFMLYQAMRPKKKQHGRKRRMEEEAEEDVATTTRGEGFNAAQYDAIMADYADRTVDELRNPLNPLGFQQVNTYKAALVNIHRQQVAAKLVPNVQFDPYIWQYDHTCLLNVVKTRKQDVATARFDEKMTGDATPFTQVDLIPQIEAALWRFGCGPRRVSQLAALRHRHAFTMSTAGIMRFESLAERNLSELFCFTWRGKRDVHDLLITMFQLPIGKCALFVPPHTLNQLTICLFFPCFCPPLLQVKPIKAFIYSVAQ